ncbi:glutaredoxin family protein [Tasmannia lanceolata]|uniref:glutaredoxin family protein n=1 Tax=Tasmannia lanceolata TaxID=3420 RepID=UPI00406358C4
MGCISSKVTRRDFKQEILLGCNDDYSNHIVSLTSSTYGVLKLDGEPIKESMRSPPYFLLPKSQNRVLVEPEIINAWELMEDLDDEIPNFSPAIIDGTNCSNFLNKMESPNKYKKFVAKENKHRKGESNVRRSLDYSNPRQVLMPFSSLENIHNFIVPHSKIWSKTPPVNLKDYSVGHNSGFSTRSLSPLFDPELLAFFERELYEDGEQIKKMLSPKRRSQKSRKLDQENAFFKTQKFPMSTRSLSPLFDPELLAFFERELSDEGEQIKKMLSPKPKSQKSENSDLIIDSFEKKCPPGGENVVILYTTTLRGIRKTFEDCNNVRSTIESYNVRVIERDVSMDSGFREELRVLMGQKEARVPLVFVKGRLIGGVDLVLKLEEERKLGVLFEGIPQAIAWCEGCGGLRFVMCMDCSGSCKILDEEKKKMVRCVECNENGLIQCPICC